MNCMPSVIGIIGGLIFISILYWLLVSSDMWDTLEDDIAELENNDILKK